MNKMNMLSAKKVKLHGMKTSKWTTKDKITQYKGLINLYNRDRKILEADTNVTKRKQIKQLKQLQKDIEENRAQLDNAIRGDRQQLRNTLADHREMQLAYQNSPPKHVLECVHQINFNKRKELDKLEFAMKQKSQVLIDIKLEISLLEDRLIFEDLGEIPAEKQSAIITGKVQDAILKKEAALAIKQTFLQIIDIMKKDALYFDSILISIKRDAEAQGDCMINATKLGQMATEYLDDRRKEYKVLEKAVKRDMIARKKDLAIMQERVQNASTTIKQLLRRDSDINLGFVELPKTNSLTNLEKDMFKIEETLTILKNNTYVTAFEAIYPCFTAQLEHKKRLTELAEKCTNERNILLNKANHAEVTRDVMRNSMVETTFEYKSEKKKLLDAIEEQKERKKRTDNLLAIKTDLLARVRISLRQLQQLVKLIGGDEPVKSKISHRKTDTADDEEIVKPEEDEIDGVKIIPQLKEKLTKLMKQEKLETEPLNPDEGMKYYEMMITEKCRIIPLEKKVSDEELIEGIEISNILTREDIKKISAEIVEHNLKSDEMLIK